MPIAPFKQYLKDTDQELYYLNYIVPDQITPKDYEVSQMDTMNVIHPIWLFRNRHDINNKMPICGDVYQCLYDQPLGYHLAHNGLIEKGVVSITAGEHVYVHLSPMHTGTIHAHLRPLQKESEDLLVKDLHDVTGSYYFIFEVTLEQLYKGFELSGIDHIPE